MSKPSNFRFLRAILSVGIMFPWTVMFTIVVRISVFAGTPSSNVMSLVRRKDSCLLIDSKFFPSYWMRCTSVCTFCFFLVANVYFSMIYWMTACWKNEKAHMNFIDVWRWGASFSGLRATGLTPCFYISWCTVVKTIKRLPVVF